jgi:hypothetical protein
MFDLHAIKVLFFCLLQWIGSSGGDSVAVKLVSEGQIEHTSRHVSRWSVSLRRSEVSLRWQCSSFQPVSGKAKPSNNRATLRVARIKGNFKPPIIVGNDQTNIGDHKDRATVNAALAGTGEVLLDLGLELTDPDAMQGPFDCKVELTITGR